MRAYVTAVLFQSLYVNLALTLLQGVLVANGTGGAYSDIFFYSTVGSVFFYGVFSFSTARQGAALHAALITLSGIFTALLCFPSFQAGSALVYGFGAVILLQDMLAPSALSSLVQERCTPNQFAEISHTLLSYQLFARAAASLLVILFGRIGLIEYSGLFGLACVVLHLYFLWHFNSREREVNPRSRPPAEIPQDSRPMRSSVRFILKNPLVRTAMIATAWGYLLKFLIDLALLQGAETMGRDFAGSALLFSQLSFVNIVCVFLFHRWIGRRWVSSRPLSYALGITPVVVLALALAAYICGGLLPIALMFIASQALGRSIHGPVARQLFLLAPLRLRHRILQLSFLNIALIATVVSGGLSYIRPWITVDATILLVAALCSVMFFVLAEIDTYHLRNLWRHYKQSLHGSWLGHSPLDVATEFAMDGPVMAEISEAPEPIHRRILRSRIQDSRPEESLSYLREVIFDPKIGAVEKKSVLIHGLETAHSLPLLRELLRKEAALLGSAQKTSQTIGEEVAFISGLPIWRERVLAGKYGELERIFEEFSLRAFAAPTRRKIRYILLDAERDGSLALAREKLRWLLRNLTPGRASAFFDVLYKWDFLEIRPLLWRCLDHEERGRISLTPLVNELLVTPWAQSSHLSLALERLGSRFHRAATAELLREGIERALRNGVQLTGLISSESREGLLKLLFLEEWLLDRRGSNAYLRETIREWHADSGDRLFVEMHLEALKASPRLFAWRILLLGALNGEATAKALEDLDKMKRPASWPRALRRR